MPEEWIASLAGEIKQKNHEAAEEYGRQQHYAGIIEDKAKPFFISVVQCLQQGVDALRSELQGDLTAAETGVQTVRACEVKISRARFPWIDATLEHSIDVITLDYAKTAGTPGDPTQDRKNKTFAFRVAPDDTLYITDAFGPDPIKYEDPADLAQHILELLFAP